MGKGGVTTTVGYWYYMGAHLALCHGPVDKITKVRFGDKVAWEGEVTTTSSIGINQPNLFGGEHREGGVVGNFDLIVGSKTEAVNTYLQSVLPNADPMPGFRGKAAIVIKDAAIGANNPNLRPVNVEVFRIPCKGWYDAKSTPGTAGGVNPAHIIRECLTDATWGMGYSEADIDDVSFRAAADVLYDEAFGLSFAWSSGSSLQDFISTVVQHIQASLYVDPFTGLFTLKLVRGDYNPATLPVLGEAEIISMDSYERSGVSELVNQVTLLWYDSATDKQRTTTVHNMAARELQGGTVATTIEFPGIPDADLANKVATRELRKFSTSVSRAVIRANRHASLNKIGDVFKLNWPDLGINDVIMRVGKIEYGNLNTGEVRLHCVEDIFSFGQVIHAPSPETLWENPITDPIACPHRKVAEAPYILVNRTLNESASLIGDLDVMTGFLTHQGSLPSYDAFSYRLHTRASGGTYKHVDTSVFCPTAIITDALVPEVTTVLNVTDAELMSQVQVGTYAYINDECVAVTAIGVNTVTVGRGILDTVPVVHPINSRIWFAENNEAIDQTAWASGVTVNAKALTTTGKGTLAEASAPEDSLVIARRWYRPYPPGNVKINGLRWPASVGGDMLISWSHRDRTTQLSYYLKQDETDFGPEVGVTYNLRVYEDTNTLVDSVTGLSGTSYSASYSRTSLLLHFDGADGSTAFTDSSPAGRTVTRYGSTKLSTAVTLLDGSCGLFDGSGDYLTVPHSAAFSVAGDLTIDVWVQPLQVGTLKFILRKGDSTLSTSYNYAFRLAMATDGTVYFAVGNGSTSFRADSTTQLQVGITYHLRAVKSGLDLHVFVNGVLEGTTTMTGTPADNTTELRIGRDVLSSRDWYGYIDELQILSNYAASTSNFTVPTAPFTPVPADLISPVRIELESERDGLTSLQKQIIQFDYT